MLADLYAYLAADTELASLLGGTGRIFRDCAPKDTAAPYLVFGISADCTEEEILCELSVRISVYAKSGELADNRPHL